MHNPGQDAFSPVSQLRLDSRRSLLQFAPQDVKSVSCEVSREPAVKGSSTQDSSGVESVNKIPVGILGAQELWGRSLSSCLRITPGLRFARWQPSERSAGKRYGEAVAWKLPVPIPRRLLKSPLRNVSPISTAGSPSPALTLRWRGRLKNHSPALDTGSSPTPRTIGWTPMSLC